MRPVSFCSLLFVSLVVVFVAVVYQFKVSLVLHPTNLQGKLYLVTGCTPGGIGYEAVQVLLQWNATVVCTMRPSKLDTLKPNSNLGLHIIPLDLTSLHSVREAATKLRQDFDKFDGIVLNAGAISVNYTVTEDGFESTFQTNHLSQFYLLQLLMDRVKTNDGKVVFVSSGLHRLGTRSDQFESKPAVMLKPDGTYDYWSAYAQSKYFNVLSAHAFAKRFPSVHFLSVSPGMVHTNIEDVIADAPDAAMNKLMMSLLGRSVKDGAVRTLQALTHAEFANMTAFHLDDYVQLPPFSTVNEENADWLYKTSNALLLL